MTNTEGLDNMNFDVLTEIGNIGAGNAVTRQFRPWCLRVADHSE